MTKTCIRYRKGQSNSDAHSQSIFVDLKLPVRKNTIEIIFVNTEVTHILTSAVQKLLPHHT